MLYIFSKKLPVVSMIIVMALRFVPLITNRAREIGKIHKPSLKMILLLIKQNLKVR